jgi:hypothetical protein
MTDALPATDQELQRIRRRLRLRLRGQGVLDMDVDDVVDQAIAKAANEQPDEDAPAFEIRAIVALRDVKADYLRRKKRRIEIDYDAELPDIPVQPTALDSVLFHEMANTLRDALGPETLGLGFYLTAGLSESDISHVSGWGTKKTAALRRGLGERAVKRFKAVTNRHDKEAA